MSLVVAARRFSMSCYVEIDSFPAIYIEPLPTIVESFTKCWDVNLKLSSAGLKWFWFINLFTCS